MLSNSFLRRCSRGIPNNFGPETIRIKTYNRGSSRKKKVKSLICPRNIIKRSTLERSGTSVHHLRFSLLRRTTRVNTYKKTAANSSTTLHTSRHPLTRKPYPHTHHIAPISPSASVHTHIHTHIHSRAPFQIIQSVLSPSPQNSTS